MSSSHLCGSIASLISPLPFYFNKFAVRKGYHALAAALFTPALFAQPQLLGMALAIALAVLAVIEVLRLGGIPWGVSARVHRFMAAFVDGRDAGAFFVTHFTLLLGLAVPVWLSNALEDAAPAALAARLWPATLAGIVITGVGDAAASVVGSWVGRVPIAAGSKKTVEGTLSSVVASLLAWAALQQLAPGALFAENGAWGGGGRATMTAGLVAATLLSSVLEASTDQLDNLVVPLHYFALLCWLL